MGFIGKLAKKYAVTSKAKVKKNPKEYNNFSTFSEKVGIIDDVKVLKKIGAPVSISSF
jgi:hypothetical protein